MNQLAQTRIVQYSPTLKTMKRNASTSIGSGNDRGSLIARPNGAKSGGITESDSLGEFRREIDNQNIKYDCEVSGSSTHVRRPNERITHHSLTGRITCALAYYYTSFEPFEHQSLKSDVERGRRHRQNPVPSTAADSTNALVSAFAR